MSSKLYFKIYLLGAVAMAMFGLVIPYFVSQKSDVAVLIGFALLFATPFVSYKAAKHIIQQVIKGTKK
ncbi:TPA: hypothetical protein LVL74_004702 [Klebsiella oxytoca]|nr:hypothetical protein [Klebsiella oxytoca]HBM3171233.1 hypothetical protein [Klebsiella oxytoca]